MSQPSPLVSRALLLSLIALLLWKTAVFSGLVPSASAGLADFQVFHAVGRMVWQGEVADAYRAATMVPAERELTGAKGFQPWTYPPPYDLLVALLAPMPTGLAYLLFTGGTLSSFLMVLRRIAGDTFPTLLLVIFPALVLTISSGQNGFLTGSLAGLACLAFEKNKALAGLPLGLMVLKPHFAAGLAVHGLAARRWRAMALAVVVGVACCVLATALLGASVWPAFLGGLAEARSFLAAGAYQLYRMTSLYAALRSLGAPAGLAGVAQALLGGVALGLVAMTTVRRAPARQALGLAALATVLVSPYAYDYDLPIFAVGLAWLLPDIARLARGYERAVLLGLTFASSGYGLLLAAILQGPASADGTLVDSAQPDPDVPSVAGFLLPAAVVLVCAILNRERAAGPPSDGVAADGPATARTTRASRSAVD